MVTLLKNKPISMQPRELWLSQHIDNNTTLQSSVKDGHVLTLTGATKGMTTDGVHFTGAATSNIVIVANAGQNSKAACHVTVRFKLDATFAAGAAGNFYLLNKVDGTTYIRVYLKAADGKLYWEQDNGAGGAGFSLTSTTVSWTAGTWYIITVSLDNAPAQRLLVNGTAQDTDTSAAIATPTGGNIIVGSSSDGGTDGIIGVISWVVMGFGATATVALTAAEETDLSKGVPPAVAKVQHMYLVDEGRGLTATDRGSLGINGTLDTACTWQWGQVKAPCLSFDGLNDSAITAANAVNLHGDWTIELIYKIKTTFNALSKGTVLLRALSSDGPNNLTFAYQITTATLNFNIVNTALAYSTHPAIDDYLVFHITRLGTLGSLYANGSLITTAIVPLTADANNSIQFGNIASGDFPDINKLIKAALIESALTTAQVKACARDLQVKYNLPGSFA